jgi:NAD(P)-dependent dehydrogenase (short-subunit alcohol dehydrogenase family)
MDGMTGRLRGRVVLITGASRGIGRAIAERFAAEGADLFLAATRVEGLGDVRAACAALGARVETHAADISDRAAAAGMVDAAARAFGRIDGLVNSAGIYKAARFVDYEPADFDRVMQVNVYGAFHVMQFTLRRMLAQGHGKIINIASTAGKWESPNQAAYNASKHALVGLTRCAALETANRGITVNAICPAFVETDMLQDFKVHADMAGISFEKLKENLLARVPMGRFVQPIEVAHLAVYLMSAESPSMTGETLTIAGGMRMG